MKELKAYKIQRQIKELNDELIKHQDKCKHKKATKEYASNTGNYDPTADCYWTIFNCPTCLKRWSVDGSV